MTITLWRDEHAPCPIEDDDSVKFVVLHRRHRNPSPEVGSTPEEVESWIEANPDWWVAKLWMYDHSGRIYAHGDRNPFSCPWDSGRVGIIALRREDFTDHDAAAEAICRSYTAWANDNCWGWTHEPTGESCGGYASREEALEDARRMHPSSPAVMTPA